MKSQPCQILQLQIPGSDWTEIQTLLEFLDLREILSSLSSSDLVIIVVNCSRLTVGPKLTFASMASTDLVEVSLSQIRTHS